MADPLSPERDELHESDLNGIVALLQLSAGKKPRKRKDVISSPSYASPGKRGRGYSPMGAALSPPARVMHAAPGMHIATSPHRAMYLQGVQELPEWMKEAQRRVERMAAAVGTVVSSSGGRGVEVGSLPLSGRHNAPRGPMVTSRVVVSKRAVARATRREMKRQAQIHETMRARAQARMADIAALNSDVDDWEGCVERDNDGAEKKEKEGNPDASVDLNEANDPKETSVDNPENLDTLNGLDKYEAQLSTKATAMDPEKDGSDKHGSLIAFIGREFLYSDVDKKWFGEGRVWIDGVLQGMGFDTTGGVKLTRAEWAALRSLMKGNGAVRRLSSQFMHDSRAELYAHRVNESALPENVFSVGQAVTAVHPDTQEVQDGVILTLAGKDFCRVQFDRVELGVQLVSNSMLRRVIKAKPSFGGLSSMMPSPPLPPMMPVAPVLHQSPQPYGQNYNYQQVAPMAMSLSNMLGAFMHHTSGSMRTPSPEKVPNYGFNGRFGLPSQSPSQLYADPQNLNLHLNPSHQMSPNNPRIHAIKPEDENPRFEKLQVQTAPPTPNFAFDEDAVKGMENPDERRQFMLDAMYTQLKAACKQSDLELIEHQVGALWGDVSRDLGDIRDDRSLMNQPEHSNYEYKLNCLDRENFKRLHQGIESHVKRLMAMLMMLERTPTMFDMFARGLELMSG